MTTTAPPKNETTELFPVPTQHPVPSSLPSLHIPRIWSGTTPASTVALLEILKDNHVRWNIFFNDQGFHNHSAHFALALWSLGAHQDILKAAYESDSKYQRKAFDSPNPVTADNWKVHLGDRRFYQAYLKFFTEEIQKKGVDNAVEEYIFSTAGNVASKGDSPLMLDRFVAGLFHPMIHTGYGLEFGLPGLVAEGLAQTALHSVSSEKVIPTALFDLNEGGDGLVSRFAAAVGLRNVDVKEPKVHAFSILARVLADSKFDIAGDVNPLDAYKVSMQKSGEDIRTLVDQWSLDGPIENKVEELTWVNVLLYTVAGWQSGKKPFSADFMLMHLVTSSLFLPSLMAHLSERSQKLLLRIYFATSLVWFISRGKPALDFGAFFDGTEELVNPAVPGPAPTPHDAANPSATSPYAITPNPWFQVIQSAIVHPDDHIPKLIRALAHCSEAYGGRQAGYFSGTELVGAEKIDGTLFVRAAGFTMGRMGWVREGDAPKNDWDRSGFFEKDSNLNANL